MSFCVYVVLKNPFQITISSTQENTNKTKVAYTAALLSWGVFTTLDNAVHLPYMLEKGEQKLGAVVKSTLQTLFDCQVKQYQFTQVFKL